MRPIFVAILAVVVLGSTKWFIDSYRPPESAGPGLQLIRATGDYSVELTLTFDVGPDEFSLADAGDAPSLLLQLNGKELLKRTDTIRAADSPVMLVSIDGVVEGPNELYVEASPAATDSLQPRSIRVRILQDGTAVADKAIWPEVGDIVQGKITLEVGGKGTGHNHD